MAAQCAADDYGGGHVMCDMHNPLPFFWSDRDNLPMTALRDEAAKICVLSSPSIDFAPGELLVPGGPDGLRLAVASARFKVQALLDAKSLEFEMRGTVWQFHWTVHMTGKGHQLDLSDPEIALASDGMILVLRPNVLEPGADYTFTLTVGAHSLPHADWAVAKTRARVNRPPTDGSLKVSPDTGSEMATKFQLVADGWVDDDDGPLSYVFAYARHPGQHATDDVMLTEARSAVEAMAYMPAGDYYFVVRVSDSLGSEARFVLPHATTVAVQELTAAAVDNVLETAGSADATVKEQLCSALAEKLNLATPLGPEAGAHGPHPKELTAEELASQTEVRSRIIDVIANAPAGDLAGPPSASAVTQSSATVASICARPDQLAPSAQVKAALLVAKLAGAGASAGSLDASGTGGALVSSLSALLSTNGSALAAAESDSVSEAVLAAAAQLGAGLLHGALAGEPPASLASPKLNVTAAREMPYKLAKAAVSVPGGSGNVRLSATALDKHAAAAAGGVDLKIASFGRNVHKDPAAAARAAFAAAEAEAAAALADGNPGRRRLAAAKVVTASEALRLTMGTHVIAVAVSSSEGHPLEVSGLKDPIVIELKLGANTASQHSADPEARAENRRCVRAHLLAYAQTMQGEWLWLNGTAVGNAYDWRSLREMAIADPATSVEAKQRYGDYNTSLLQAPFDLPSGAEGEALQLGRATAEVLSTRALVYEMALACPQPAAASCTYWDEPGQRWSSEGCVALPRKPEFSYGLHLLEGGPGAECEEAKVLQCACTHLTDFAGLSIPLNSEELMDQIMAVHVNTFSFHDFSHAMTHFDYAANAAIYDLVFSLAFANAVGLMIACVFDWRSTKAVRRKQQLHVTEALLTRKAAREAQEAKWSNANARNRGREGSGKKAGESLAKHGWTEAKKGLSINLHLKVTGKLRDEHTLLAVFMSDQRHFSRAQLVQIFFNIIAVELVTECMLFSAPENSAEAVAEAMSAAVAVLVAAGADPIAARAQIELTGIPEEEDSHDVVTFILTSMITSAVCLPAMLAFKHLWFLYEWYPFNKCLRAASRDDMSLAAIKIQAAHRSSTARREREVRERAALVAQAHDEAATAVERSEALKQLRQSGEDVRVMHMSASDKQPRMGRVSNTYGISAATIEADAARAAESEVGRQAEVVRRQAEAARNGEIRRLTLQAEALLRTAHKQRKEGEAAQVKRTLAQSEAVRAQLLALKEAKNHARQLEELKRLRVRSAVRKERDDRAKAASERARVNEAIAADDGAPHGSATAYSAALAARGGKQGVNAKSRPHSESSDSVASTEKLNGYARLDEEAEARNAEEALPAPRKQTRAMKLSAKRIERTRLRSQRALESANNRWAHWPLIYFQAMAWVTMWMCHVFCSMIIITYGQVMGSDASRSMLTSWSIALGQTFFVHEPLMITLSAAAPVFLKTLAALTFAGSAFSRFACSDDVADRFWEWIDYFSQC